MERDDNHNTVSGCACGFPGCPQCRDALQKQPLASDADSVCSEHGHQIIKLGAAALCSKEARRSLMESTKSKCHGELKRKKSHMVLGAMGVVLMSAAYAMFITDPLDLIITWQMNVMKGSYAFDMWRKPPVEVYVRVFVFNVTNKHEFLSGLDDKLNVTEVGPYVYREVLENMNVSFNPNSTVTYYPKRQVIFVPEQSVGDPNTDIVTVTNVPLLGAASMLHKSSAFTNFAFRTLLTYLKSQPILPLTVHDFLWGYEDPLVRLGNNIVPSYVNFEKFGLLDRMYNLDADVMTMRSGRNAGVDPDDPNPVLHDVFSIDTYDGSPGLDYWGYGSESLLDPVSNTSGPEELACNMVRGALEGLMYPRKVTPRNSMTVYRHAFCRTLPVVFHSEQEAHGMRAFRYTLSHSSMDPRSPENACFCRAEEQCLPTGLSDVAPCYYNIPLAISKPHFLHGEEWLYQGTNGLDPDPTLHDSHLIMQPDMGIPLQIKTKLQLSLVMKKTKMNSKISRFDNLAVPIFWLEFSLDDLPENIKNLMRLALNVGPVAQMVLMLLLAVAGGAMVGVSIATALGVLGSRQSKPHRPEAHYIAVTKKRRKGGHSIVHMGESSETRT